MLRVVLGLMLVCSGGLVPAVALADEPVLPRARPLTDRVFEPSSARVERGRYFSEHLLQCFMCHSERDWDAPGAPIVAGKLLARQTGDKTDIELIALSPTRYIGSGLLAPLEFTLPESGAATRIVSQELEHVVLERVP